MCLRWPCTTRRKAAYLGGEGEEREKSVQNPEKDIRLPRLAVIRQPCMKESERLGIPARVVTMTSLPALQSPAQQFAP